MLLFCFCNAPEVFGHFCQYAVPFSDGLRLSDGGWRRVKYIQLAVVVIGRGDRRPIDDRVRGQLIGCWQIEALSPLIASFLRSALQSEHATAKQIIATDSAVGAVKPLIQI